MAVVVIIGGGHGLRIELHRRNQRNKSKLSLYKPLLLLFNILFKLLYTSNKTERFSYKGGCSVHGHMHIKCSKRAGLGYR